jgi:hypothetical protein
MARSSLRTRLKTASLFAGVPLISAAIAGGAALAGAKVGADATVESQRRLIDEQRLAGDRTKRATVYTRFQWTADRYAYEAAKAFRRCGRRVRCKALEGRVQTARFNFQGGINDVYVYGSRDAWSAAREVARALPSSSIGLSGTIRAQPVSVEEFQAAYNRFLDVMCRELTAVRLRPCPDRR